MLKVAESTSAESAIRQYLIYLQDPSKLIDRSEVKRLEAKVAAAKDPVERLKAIAALSKSQGVDGDSFRYDFIRHARTWAQQEDIPESAFREIGVPDDVLRAAFGKGTSTKRPAKAAKGRRSRSSFDDLATGIAALSGTFTLKEIMQRVGGSPVTVKNVVSVLEGQGRLVPAQPKAGARGRAARAWKVA